MTRRVPRVPLALSAVSIAAYLAQLSAVAEVRSAFALIDIQPAASGIVVSSKAFALDPVEVQAEMIIERSGKTGTVSTRQSRALKLRPGKTEDIAITGVNFGDGDTVVVRVLLKQDGVVVAESIATAGE